MFTLESSSSNERVLVGQIGRPHGLAGWVRIRDLTDNPNRFRRGQVVWVGERLLEIVGAHREGEELRVKFAGLTDRMAVEQLRYAWLEIETGHRRRLDAEEFWPDQLEGLLVRTEQGELVGRVREVIEGVGQDRLRIELEEDGGLQDLPFVRDLVPRVDLEQGELLINPPLNWLLS